MINKKLLVLSSGILGFLAVSLGAFGAHALKDKVSAEQLSIFQTGVLYHIIHAVVVLVIAIAGENRFFKAAIFMITGIVLFSFSLYIYSITQIKLFAMITPMGGVSFLAGWLMIIIEGLKTRKLL
jgi:uncharacterized membrane protein YgdD (TMEM256/DUF423 family)